MKKIKYIATIFLSGLLLITASCSDEMAKINSNPSQVTEANISYLFAQAVFNFEPAGYLPVVLQRAHDLQVEPNGRSHGRLHLALHADNRHG